MSALSSREITWAVIAHLAPIAIIVPFGNIILPLVIMLTVGKESDFVYQNAKESLNFQITMIIYWIIAILLALLLVGFLLAILLYIFQIVVMILAVIASSKGEVYHYPLSIRFIR